jgi:hypothetical protein
MKTDSEISEDEDLEIESETLYERVAALKDMIPPSARRNVSNTVSSITNLTKATLSFSGKTLWIISTSAFLLGVPFALAYAEEEQYIQMEREQGMIKGANEVCFFLPCLCSSVLFVLSSCNTSAGFPIRVAYCHRVQCLGYSSGTKIPVPESIVAICPRLLQTQAFLL